MYGQRSGNVRTSSSSCARPAWAPWDMLLRARCENAWKANVAPRGYPEPGKHQNRRKEKGRCMKLQWPAWNNGKHHASGGGYGLKVPVADRDRHFERGWKTVILELPFAEGVREVHLNVDKPSFWGSTCRELISLDIGQWLIAQGYAHWPSGRPPKIEVQALGSGRFRVLSGQHKREKRGQL